MDYVSDDYEMFSGSADAESKVYNLVVGKSGKRWLYTDYADNIYVEGVPNSRGFGGRTLTFELINGSEIKLTGPWHTNAETLYRDTSVDLRDKHLTFIVVALERVRVWPKIILKDVIYKDEKPLLGLFNRGDIIAKKLAIELNKTVFVYRQSKGGSSCGPVTPERII